AQASKDSCDGTWSFLKPCTHNPDMTSPQYVLWVRFVLYKCSARGGHSAFSSVLHRIVYKTAYRQAVKIDYRKRYRCCQGYYENADVCVPSCTKECVHGRCVAPDQCQCEQGWRGADCSSMCDGRSWGPHCENPCQCGDGGACDPLTGACVCSPGYKDPMCREECPIGKYGQDCGQPCDCANGGRCFHINGACLCDAGFYGPRCEERACLDGLYGLACHLPCLCSPQHSQSCHPISGECTCQPGWAGLHCNETCPHGYHGANCQEPCLCLNGGTCDGATGLCRCTPGYTVSEGAGIWGGDGRTLSVHGGIRGINTQLLWAWLGRGRKGAVLFQAPPTT
uniref:Platelet endothelial aggregation receptor 1 n=1 Tax=Chelydra serpentina TaxID=8475 RepID=A0A8C3RW96_CHESE